MFKTKVGYSNILDSFESGVEVANKIVNLENLKFGLVFTNSDMNQSKLTDGIKTKFNNIPYIGCTSSNALIVKEGILSNGPFAGMMGFGGDDLVVGVAGGEADKNPIEVGKSVARSAILNAGIKKVPSYFMMFSTPGYEELYLDGIKEVIGEVPFFGGTTIDNSISKDYALICNDSVIKDGVVVAFFYSNNECKTLLESAYIDTDNYGVITKVSNNREIDTINDIDASLVYSKWLNVDKTLFDKEKLFTFSILNPLGVVDANGNIIVKHPLYLKGDKVCLTSNIYNKSSIIKLDSSENDIFNKSINTIDKLNNKMKKEVEAYLLIHDIGLEFIIQNRTNELYKKIKEQVKDKDFIMPFLLNEFGNLNSLNTCGSLMISYTAFSK